MGRCQGLAGEHKVVPTGWGEAPKEVKKHHFSSYLCHTIHVF